MVTTGCALPRQGAASLGLTWQEPATAGRREARGSLHLLITPWRGPLGAVTMWGQERVGDS